MNAEWTLQQMVQPFADVDVEARIAVLQHDLLNYKTHLASVFIGFDALNRYNETNKSTQRVVCLLVALQAFVIRKQESQRGAPLRAN